MAPSNMLEKSEVPMLEILEGRDKGKIFDILAEKITLGRGEGNDIILASDGVSRNHAVLERNTNGSWYIRDMQSRNGVLVNGRKVDIMPLQNGDLVQIGDYTFRFREVLPAPGEMNAAPVASLKSVGPPNRRPLIYGILILVVGLVLYMNSQTEEKTAEDSTPKKTAEAAEDLTKMGRDFKTSPEPNLEENKKDLGRSPVAIEDPTMKQAEVDLGKVDWANSALKEAEQNYRKGQRELMSKNYGRAIEAFQTALSFNRSHELASKYLKLAVFEAELDAKKQMEIGVKYFESLQYQRAMYHFSEVVNLMQHRPNEAIVGQAQKYIELCKKRLQASELFP